MKVNIEIEVKSRINEKTYQELLSYYDLNSLTFKQTNYYFDTPELNLLNQFVTLRIREKNNSCKITLKQRAPNGCLEQHLIIDSHTKHELLKNGFNVGTYFQNIDYEVKYLAKLVNTRVKMLYDGGTIFLDKSTYNNITDYEIEYEHNDYKLCQKNFLSFLEKHHIKYEALDKKSYRALMAR